LFVSLPHSHDNTVNRFLLDTGKIDVNARNKYGRTLLHETARFGNHELFRILLERGADSEKPDNEGKRVIDLLNSNNFFSLDQAVRDQLLKTLEEFKK